MRRTLCFLIIWGSLTNPARAQLQDDWEVTTPAWKKRQERHQIEYGGIRDLVSWQKAFEKRFNAGDTEAVKFLLKLNRSKELGFDLNTRFESGKTYLHRAAGLDQSRLINVLLDFGADVNIQTDDGDTPLHIAMAARASQATDVLLKAKDIDLDLKNKNGETAILVAIGTRQCERAEKLRKSGAGIDAEQEIYGKTVVDWIIESDNYCALRLFEELAKDVDARLLHKAARNSAHNILKYLLNLGIDARVVDDEGLTAFDHAVQALDLQGALIIANHDAYFFSVRLPNGDTLLHQLINTGSAALIQEVLESKADFTVFDKKAKFPWDLFEERLRWTFNASVDTPGTIQQMQAELKNPSYDETREAWNKANPNARRPTKDTLKIELAKIEREYKNLKKLKSAMSRRKAKFRKILSDKNSTALAALVNQINSGATGKAFCEMVTQLANVTSLHAEDYGLLSAANGKLLYDKGCGYRYFRRKLNDSESDEIMKAFLEGNAESWFNARSDREGDLCSLHYRDQNKWAVWLSVLDLSLVFGERDLAVNYLNTCAAPYDSKSLHYAATLFGDDEIRRKIETAYPLRILPQPNPFDCYEMLSALGFHERSPNVTRAQYSRNLIEKLAQSKQAMFCRSVDDPLIPQVVVDHSLIRHFARLSMQRREDYADILRMFKILSKSPFLAEAVAERANDKSTFLHDAVTAKHLELALQLIELGADLNAKSKMTPGKSGKPNEAAWLAVVRLHATAEARLKFLKYAVRRGADLNQADDTGHGVFFYFKVLFGNSVDRDFYTAELRKLGARK